MKINAYSIMGMFQAATLLLFAIVGVSTPDLIDGDGLVSYPLWIIFPIGVSLTTGAMMLMQDYRKKRC